MLVGAPSANFVWSKLISALVEAPTLKFVSLPVGEAMGCLDDLKLFSNPSIELVRCRADPKWAEDLMDTKNTPESVRKRMQWIDINEP